MNKITVTFADFPKEWSIVIYKINNTKFGGELRFNNYCCGFIEEDSLEDFINNAKTKISLILKFISQEDLEFLATKQKSCVVFNNTGDVYKPIFHAVIESVFRLSVKVYDSVNNTITHYPDLIEYIEKNRFDIGEWI